jgi:hypothetical protein
VSFATKDRKRFDPNDASRHAARGVGTATIVRAVVLAALGIIAAGWGLVAHFTEKRAPMLVPAQPPPSATYDADAGEIPVPELEPAP